jgi:hypothetical protein
MALEEPGCPASEAASAVSTGIAPLPFKPESADVGFPWAGAGLLLLLIVVAVAAKWRGMSARPAWLARLAPASSAPLQGELQVEATTRLNPQVQLHVVSWSGRRILLATASNMPPVVLDRQNGEPVDKEQP